MSKSEVFDQRKCIFCNCLKKRGDVTLIRITTPQVQDNIKKAAQTLSDNELLVKVLNAALIAVQEKYHKNCMADVLTRAKRSEDKNHMKNQTHYLT